MFQQIPERYRPGLVKLASFDDDTIAKLVETLKICPPTLHLEDIASLAYKQYGIDIKDTSDIVLAIKSLYPFREDEYISTEKFVSEIGRALQNDSKDVSDEAIDKLQKRLLEFLEIEGSLEIASKADVLKTEYENIFSNSRILTDLRPVFKTDIEDGIGGALISHVLRIRYDNINGSQELFLTLDSYDISKFAEQVERALEKEEVLKKFLSNSNIPYLDIYPVSE